mmetsp:Transcript_28894/g.77844  ORF Transcript_28894/g.77844 Transcript_28894/m.77844 type:complete len:91 (+) Transcript_28894:1048-1320(+)
MSTGGASSSQTRQTHPLYPTPPHPSHTHASQPEVLQPIPTQPRQAPEVQLTTQDPCMMREVGSTSVRSQLWVAFHLACPSQPAGGHGKWT